MTQGLFGLSILFLSGVAAMVYWYSVRARHEKRIEQIEVRIHVNGIRGKSSVTRLVAGALREGGFVTVAKTTGSAARVIDPEGREHEIRRHGAPTILEQLDVVRDWVDSGVEALVVECMAIRPLFQQYSQNFMVRSDITIITNVRADHQEYMGESLEEIADALSLTIPRGGILITTEDRPHLRERLRRNAEARDCRFIYADPAVVHPYELRGFEYLQFAENLAIGMAVARVLGIGRAKAVHGMHKAVPDIGSAHLTHFELRGKQVLWAPLFAANDRESLLANIEMLKQYHDEDATVIGILNNRWDRGRRAEHFARFVPEDLSDYLHHVVTFGGYEPQVSASLVDHGFPRERITNMGESVNPSLEELLDTIADLIDGPTGVLIGMVNIHTEQAEMIQAYLEERRAAAPDTFDLSRKVERMSPATQRQLRAMARLTRYKSRDE